MNAFTSPLTILIWHDKVKAMRQALTSMSLTLIEELPLDFEVIHEERCDSEAKLSLLIRRKRVQ